jgi:hypothetical protein
MRTPAAYQPYLAGGVKAHFKKELLLLVLQYSYTTHTIAICEES